MSEKQADIFKQLLGSNKGEARITVSRSLADKRFGRGGEVMVSVTTNCVQDAQFMQRTVKELGLFVDGQFDEQVEALRELLKKHGIMDPEGRIYE